MKKYILCPECRWFGTIDITEFNMWKGQKLYSCSRGMHAFTHAYLMDLKKRGEVTMVNIKDFFPTGNYMTAEQVKNKEIPETLTITAVEPETIRDQQKLVASFKETDKKLVLNKTNSETIAEKLGDETADWTGAKINLSVIKVNFRGQLVDAIRVSKVTKK